MQKSKYILRSKGCSICGEMFTYRMQEFSIDKRRSCNRCNLEIVDDPDVSAVSWKPYNEMSVFVLYSSGEGIIHQIPPDHYRELAELFKN